MIHWIVLHIDSERIMLRSVKTELATFRVKDYQEMYHLPHPVITMEKPFSTHNNVNSRDILKSWVKEPATLRTTPILVYKTKILLKTYQYLVIFSCQLYGQENIETFPQSWVIVLDQLASEGRPCI